MGIQDTSKVHRVESINAHNAGPAVWGSRYGIAKPEMARSIRTRDLMPAPIFQRNRDQTCRTGGCDRDPPLWAMSAPEMPLQDRSKVTTRTACQRHGSCGH
jgi:hypothetical protein